MDYQTWCKRSRYLLYETDKFNAWRERTKYRLLTDVSPRIGKLSRSFYMGCGFHYYMEEQLGKLLSKLSMPIQWSANHCDKIENDQIKMIVMEVAASELIRSVVRAERSIKTP
jgi:hypothetical protein